MTCTERLEDRTFTDTPASVTATSGNVTYWLDDTTVTAAEVFLAQWPWPPKRPLPPVPEYVAPSKYRVSARHGFQQMCRIPCYRGVRTR